MFYGQIKSRVQCNKCSTISNTFDPFLALSVPLGKKEKDIILRISYFPMDLKDEAKIVYVKAIPKDTVESVKSKMRDILGLQKSVELMIYSHNRGRSYKRYANKKSVMVLDDQTLGC